jgi:hypothetical protein
MPWSLRSVSGAAGHAACFDDSVVENPRVLPGVVAGVIGGAAGATAMVVFNHLLAATGYGVNDRGRHDRHHRRDAKPNDMDGTISDEPASIKVSAGVIERRTGSRLPEAQRRAMGAIAHHVFGASVGGLYGGLSARIPAITLGGGLPYGAFLWVAAAETGLPLAGLARRPDTYPIERHVASLATHLVFGVTLEAVRRLLMTAWRSPG